MQAVFLFDQESLVKVEPSFSSKQAIFCFFKEMQ